jgi:hypothetical protein
MAPLRCLRNMKKNQRPTRPVGRSLRGPEVAVPRSDAEETAAWVWTLRHKQTGETRELLVSVTWRGFDSIDEVPSVLARQAFGSAGRSGVDWYLASGWDKWDEVIFHSQTRKHHASYDPSGPPRIVRLEAPPDPS